MSVAVFILAGGSGIRLWPLSRQEKPKQFLPVFPDGTSFFEKTLTRALKITTPENIFVLTRQNYYSFVKDLAKDIPQENILTEVCKKNTAPVIACAMAELQKKRGNTTAVILPSDHHITNEELFCNAVEKACILASENKGLVTIGLSPTRPATSYGYIEYKKANACDGIFNVLSFTEKPDAVTAERFLLSEKYLWNSGIFIWTTKAILESFKLHTPEIYALAKKISDASSKKEKDDIYCLMPDISIDYAILEKTKNISVVKGDFGWDDIGSWERYEGLFSADENGNRYDSNSILIASSNCTAITKNSKTLMLGADNIFVINTGDAVLIFPEDKANSIGNLTEILNSYGLYDLI